MVHEAYFLGMHLVWWFVWVVVFFAIFAIQRWKKDSPRQILHRRYTIGEITVEEYNMRREHFLEISH